MKGIIKIITGGFCKVAHPLFTNASPRAAGVRILRWLQKNEENMALLQSRVEQVKPCSSENFKAEYGDEESFLDVGIGILQIILTSPLPLLLVDCSAIISESPKDCVVYEIDLDAGTFATYRNATIPSIPAQCWVINRKTNFMTGAPISLCADATCFQFSALPCVERYLSFWPKKAMENTNTQERISKVCASYPAHLSLHEVVFWLKECATQGSGPEGLLADAASWLERLNCLTEQAMSYPALKHLPCDTTLTKSP